MSQMPTSPCAISPMTVAVLRKKLKLKDGGNTYIFATTTDGGEHVLLITHKE